MANISIKNLEDLNNLSGDNRLLISHESDIGFLTKNVKLSKLDEFLYDVQKERYETFFGGRYSNINHQHQMSSITDLSNQTHTMYEITDLSNQIHVIADIIDFDTHTHQMSSITDLSNQTHTMSEITDLSNQTHTMSEITDLTSQTHAISDITDFDTHRHDVTQIDNISDHTHEFNQINNLTQGVFEQISSLTYLKIRNVGQVDKEKIVSLSDECITLLETLDDEINIDFDEDLTNEEISRHTYVLISNKTENNCLIKFSGEYQFISDKSDTLDIINSKTSVLLEFIEVENLKFFVHRYEIQTITPQTIQTYIIRSPIIVDMDNNTLVDWSVTEYKRSPGDTWTFNNAPTTVTGYTFHGWMCNGQVYNVGDTIKIRSNLNMYAVYSKDKTIKFIDGKTTLKDYIIYDNKTIYLNGTTANDTQTPGQYVDSITYPVIDGINLITTWDKELPDITKITDDIIIQLSKHEIGITPTEFNDIKTCLKNEKEVSGNEIILIKSTDNSSSEVFNTLAISEDKYLTIA